MAGIIDRKSQIIDYTLTENGRSQIQSGDIRFVFASVSDKSILYEKDFEKSILNSEDVATTNNYIPFEVDTKTFSNINNEFDLDKTFTITNSNLLNTIRSENSEYSNVSFDQAANIFLEKNCIGSSLKNLGLISQKTFLNSTGLSFVEIGNLSSDFDFKDVNLITRYPTIKSLTAVPKDMVTISLDKRFENKTNFMKLVPKTIDGNNLYDESFFIKDQAEYKNVCIESIYKTINTQLDYENISNRNDLILKVLDYIEKNNDIQKREYIVKQSSERDSFIFNMYEANEQSDKIEKLAIIDLGRLFNNENGKSKKVYLAGKIINTKDDSKDLEEIYTFNQGEILKNTNNTNFSVSAYYSFVCLFTIVLE